MPKNSLVYISLVFLANVAFSQTIVGLITTGEEEVPFTKIELYKDNKFISETVTDLDGKFKFKHQKEGTYKLISEYIGCKKDTTTIRISKEKEFYINIKLACDWIKCNAEIESSGEIKSKK